MAICIRILCHKKNRPNIEKVIFFNNGESTINTHINDKLKRNHCACNRFTNTLHNSYLSGLYPSI